jgi:hypothetical protein
MTDPALCDPYRADLTRLRTTGVKLHWRDLDARRCQRAIEMVAQFDARILIVIASPMDHRKQERARAICLERLARELQEHGATRAVLEARTASLMRKDDHTIDRLRSRCLMAPALRFEHRQPHSDPMLWAAVVVLGAVGAALADEAGAAVALNRFAGAMSIVQVEL